VELGVYVLGAVSPAERAEFDNHLAQCPICSEELARLSGLPAVLDLVDTATAEAIAGHGEVDLGRPGSSPVDATPRAGWAGPTVMSPVGGGAGHRPQARRSRRRIGYGVLAAAAAACLAFVLGLAVSGLVAQRSPSLVAMQPVSATTPVTASVALTPFRGGTKVLMRCAYTGGSDRGQWTFRLAVVPRTGAPAEEIGNWMAGYGDDLEVSGYTRLPVADIARVELRKGDGTTLLTYQR
jgi:hypothetical protein